MRRTTLKAGKLTSIRVVTIDDRKHVECRDGEYWPCLDGQWIGVVCRTLIDAEERLDTFAYELITRTSVETSDSAAAYAAALMA